MYSFNGISLYDVQRVFFCFFLLLLIKSILKLRLWWTHLDSIWIRTHIFIVLTNTIINQFIVIGSREWIWEKIQRPIAPDGGILTALKVTSTTGGGVTVATDEAGTVDTDEVALPVPFHYLTPDVPIRNQPNVRGAFEDWTLPCIRSIYNISVLY